MFDTHRFCALNVCYHVGEDEKKIRRQSNAGSEEVFISHRRSEAIYIYYIHIHLSTVNVSYVLVFVNKYLVK